MLQNYLTIALRNLLRQKGITLLNIIGLAVGMAACLFITAYVREELTWDQFNEKGDRLGRVIMTMTYPGKSPQLTPYTMPAVGPAMKEGLPEIVRAARTSIGFPYKVFRESDFLGFEMAGYVDPDFLEMYTFPILEGSQTPLDRPDAIVLTKSTANTLFGDEPAVGQTIDVGRDRANANPKVVTAIVEDPPTTSTHQFTALVPFTNYTEDFGWGNLESWDWFNFPTYVELAEGVSFAEAEAKFPEFFAQHKDPETTTFSLQPYLSIHLYDALYSSFASGGDIRVVYALIALALLILIVACVNFINMATAQSARRAREVGMRKVIGARKSDLVIQYIGEAFLVALISALLAILLVELLKPTFMELAGRTVQIDLFGGGFITLALLLLIGLVGLLSGFYPALVMSGFQPAAVLKGSFRRGRKGNALRRVLVVFQFTVSIALIVGALLIHRQMEYVRSKDLGFKKEGVAIIYPDTPIDLNEADLATRLESVPGVTAASITSGAPGDLRGQMGLRLDGTEETRLENFWWADPGAYETFGLELVEGRFLSLDYPSDVLNLEDSTVAAVLNESAVRKFGLEEPVGSTFRYSGGIVATVVGVVKDFHLHSLHRPITPLVIINDTRNAWLPAVRFRTGDLRGFMHNLEGEWSQLAPESVFEAHFLDDLLTRQYEEEMRQSTLVSVMSTLAVLIAMIGLVGLTFHATEQRTREIGVRKVLGASVSQILTLLNREFVLLVLVANLFAWPLAWWVINRWLDNFSYRAPIAWWSFPLAGVAAVLFASLIISMQTFRAANRNPAEVLRDE
ncbi:ABC transporter permease [bacterium]|nr:ABC transporter permease [bacterium]